ncbi:hypothetical protein LCGC14_2664430, partial [marine sediment metagenome]
YYGGPRMMAAALKINVVTAQNFQRQYFAAFPGIKKWHHAVAQELQTTGKLTTPLGRKRQFWGRLWDDTTLREGIAYVPQSMVADILNLGLWRVWKELGTWFNTVQLLAQVHDAILIQYSEEVEAEVLPIVCALLEIPVTHGGRTMAIPTDVAVGWNWGHASDENPDGLEEWKGSDERRRTTDPLLHRYVR